jgi:hypothetical protein
LEKLTRRIAAAGIALPLVLLVGAAPAFAHAKQPTLNQKGPSGHVTLLQGLVTGWSAGSGNLQIQTQNGSVTATVTGATHVVRMVSGSLADLHAKQHVEAHLVSGTTTIDSIRIDAAVVNKPKDQHQHPSGTKLTHTKPLTPPKSNSYFNKANAHHGPPDQVSGQVTSVGTNTITLLGWNYKTTTYALSSSLTITKAINGSSADIAIGETVRVSKAGTGNAVSVTIINA